MMTENKKHILIVEDDESLSSLLGDLLVGENFKVSFAQTGKQGLQLALDLLPDLMVLDVMLPEMNGKEVLKQVRADERLENTPVFVLTNISDTENILEMSELGKTFYFLKVDISLEKVLEKIKTQLSLYE